MPNDLRSELNELIKEREALEAEAEGIRAFLLAPGPNGAPPAGLRGTPLVDDEGFPRADIDVYDVRAKRHRLACIDTDYALLMTRIEELVKRIHEEARAAGNVRPPSASTQPQRLSGSSSSSTAAAAGAAAPMEVVEKEEAVGEAEVAGLEPFALIDQVFQHSPAEEAGVKEGDLLLKFGSVDHTNHDGFRAVVGVVGDSVGRAVRVVVRRGAKGEKGRAVALSLTPHEWSGRGLLGCHLSPV